MNYVKRIGDSNPTLNFNENTVAKDFNVFTNLYKNESESKDVEDSFSGILSEIEILKATSKEKKHNITLKIQKEILFHYRSYWCPIGRLGRL